MASLSPRFCADASGIAVSLGTAGGSVFKPEFARPSTGLPTFSLRVNTSFPAVKGASAAAKPVVGSVYGPNSRAIAAAKQATAPVHHAMNMIASSGGAQAAATKLMSQAFFTALAQRGSGGRQGGERPAIILQVQVLDAEDYPRRFLCAVSGTALHMGLERSESAVEGMADSGTLGGAVLSALKRLSMTGHAYPFAWTTLGAEVWRLGGLWLAAGFITPAEARVIGVDKAPTPPLPRRVVPPAPIPPVAVVQATAPPAAGAVKWSDAGDHAGCVPCAAARLARHVRALGAFGYCVAVARPLAGGAGVGAAAGATSAAGSRLLVGMRLGEVDVNPAILRAWGLDVECTDVDEAVAQVGVEDALAGGGDVAVMAIVDDSLADAGQTAEGTPADAGQTAAGTPADAGQTAEGTLAEAGQSSDTDDEGASDGLPVDGDDVSSVPVEGRGDRAASGPGDADVEDAPVPDGTAALPGPPLRRGAPAAAAASPADGRGASAAAEVDGGSLSAVGSRNAEPLIAPAALSPGAPDGRADPSAAPAASAPSGPEGAGAATSAENSAAARSGPTPLLVLDISIDGLYPLAPNGDGAAAAAPATTAASAASLRTVSATASVHVADWPSVVRGWSGGRPTATHFGPLSAVQEALSQFLWDGTTCGPLDLPSSVSPAEVAAATAVLPLRLLHIAASRLASTSTACAVCHRVVGERVEHFGASGAVCLDSGGRCAAAARGRTASGGWERQPVQPGVAGGAPEGDTAVAGSPIAVPAAAMDRLAMDLLRHPDTVDLVLYLAGQAANSPFGTRLDPSPPFLPTVMAEAVDTGGGVGTRRSTTLQLSHEGLLTFLGALQVMPPVADLADVARTGGITALSAALNGAHRAAAAVAAWVVGSMPGVLRVAAPDEPPFVLQPPPADVPLTPGSSQAGAAGAVATSEPVAPQDAAGAAAAAAAAERLPQTFLVGGGEAAGEWAFQAAVTAAVAAGHTGSVASAEAAAAEQRSAAIHARRPAFGATVAANLTAPRVRFSVNPLPPPTAGSVPAPVPGGPTASGRRPLDTRATPSVGARGPPEPAASPAAPTIYAFHGSSAPNWHSILRNGLDSREALNGRSLGDGVYVARQFTTSAGYACRGTLSKECRSGFDGYRASRWRRPMPSLAIVGIVEVLAASRASVGLLGASTAAIPEGCVRLRGLTVSNWKAASEHGPPDAASRSRPPWQCGTTSELALPPWADELAEAPRRSPPPRCAQPVLDAGDGGRDGPPRRARHPPACAVHHPTAAVGGGRAPLAPGAATRIMRDLRAVARDGGAHGLRAWPAATVSAAAAGDGSEDDTGDDLSVVHVHIGNWAAAGADALPLAVDLAMAGLDGMTFEVRFPPHYPAAPPFVRLLAPRMVRWLHGGGGHVTAGGSLCIAALTPVGWAPSTGLLDLLLLVREAVGDPDPVPARVDMARVGQPYELAEALDAYVRVAQGHGWLPLGGEGKAATGWVLR